MQHLVGTSGIFSDNSGFRAADVMGYTKAAQGLL